MITQAQLDAGGRAVMKLADENGFGSWINFDKARGLAAVVLKADREVTAQAGAAKAPEAAASNAPPTPVPAVAVSENHLAIIGEHAVDWFKDVGKALTGQR